MSYNSKISLVHIGLAKTATPDIQNLWLKDNNVSLVHQGLLQIVQKARAGGKDAKLESKIPLKWQFDTKPEDHQHIVLSHEALSLSYINERAVKHQIIKFQEIAARLISHIAPGTKILITVRQPETWIESIYRQAVKQGSTDTFPDFLRLENDFIAQSLDIDNLVGIWGKYFGRENILVLPVELMWNDITKFFDEIFRFSDLPIPDLTLELNANPSMKASHLRLMKKFNELVELFTKHGLYQGQLPPQTKQALDIIRFALRYSLESPSTILESAITPVEMTLPDCEIDPASIDPAFLSGIKHNYDKIIGKEDFWGFRDLYCNPSNR